jgi:aspartokinase
MSPVLVQKFGGTSVGTPERRQMVVEHVRRARDAGYLVAIVVSAIGRRGDPYATDTLLDLLRADGAAVNPSDYTLMFVTGEIISVALMSHTLNRAGIPACGLSGAQARIFTDGHATEAEILGIDVSRMHRHLERGEVPVVTGGQGIERESFDFNTLGRGASDTSGVAVGVALGAERVDIFTDVEGVATADPRVVPGATTTSHISFERMHELARFGAKVIHPRAVKAGWRGRTPLVVRSTFSALPGTTISESADDSPFSGIAALSALATVTVPNGSIDVDTLALWERRRLIMNLVDRRTGRLVLGCAQPHELAGALEDVCVAADGAPAPLSWVSVVGESGFVAARAAADADVLASVGAPPVHEEAGAFRSTFLVDPSKEHEAVRTLHGAYMSASAQTPCP